MNKVLSIKPLKMKLKYGGCINNKNCYVIVWDKLPKRSIKDEAERNYIAKIRRVVQFLHTEEVTNK